MDNQCTIDNEIKDEYIPYDPDSKFPLATAAMEHLQKVIGEWDEKIKALGDFSDI